MKMTKGRPRTLSDDAYRCVWDCLMQNTMSIKQIGYHCGVSRSTVHLVRDAHPLFFGLPNEYHYQD